MGNKYSTCKECHYKFKPLNNKINKKICSHCKHFTNSRIMRQYEQSLKPPSNQYDINKAHPNKISYSVWRIEI